MSRTHDVMISAFDLDRLEAELTAVTKQRDMLAGELDALKQSILDLSHPNMKLLLEERNEAREQIVANHKATLVIERMFYEAREQRDRAQSKIENQAERIKYLEGATNHATGTPLSKMTEQRDRLAEALREIDMARLDDFMGPHDMALKCVLIARKTLAAWKGGQP